MDAEEINRAHFIDIEIDVEEINTSSGSYKNDDCSGDDDGHSQETCHHQRVGFLEMTRSNEDGTTVVVLFNKPISEMKTIIQNGDFYFEVEDSETKLMKETSYELLKYKQKKQLGKNNKSKMTLYNALSNKEYERIDLLTQEYEKFSISNEETIDSGFTKFNAIMTSLKSLDPDYPNKNNVRKFLRAFSLKWRTKVTAIEEAKDLATLPLDELSMKWDQTSDDSDSQRGSDEEIDEEEAEAFNLLARNFQKFFRKARQSVRKPKENKAFVGGAWSDSKDDDEHQNDATCPMENEKLLKFNKDFAKTFKKLLNEKRYLESKNSKLLSKLNDLEFEVKKLVIDKENYDIVLPVLLDLILNLQSIMEELVKDSKRRAFWSLNEDYYSEDQYAVSIKEDTAYLYQAWSLLQEIPNMPYPTLGYAINTVYPLPLDMTYRSSGTETEILCMTRSSTYELFTPYKEPERELRSYFKTLSLDELRSPDFNLLSGQEYSEEEEAEAMAETLE
ncbi:hypothetical protein Tco_0129377 [Tanacetum coccineum]